MVRTTTRALAAEDKEARRASVLDAAEALLAEQPGRVPSAEELAFRAGMSKGTLYLYFAVKEDVLLALHERNKDAFFNALRGRIDEAALITIDDMIALTHQHMTGKRDYLPLASLVMGVLQKGVSQNAAAGFKQRLGMQLVQCGQGLDRHFDLPTGQGFKLLSHSYGLIIGLWNLAVSDCALGKEVMAANIITTASYPAEVERALRDLWAGRIAHLRARTPPVTHV